MPIVVVLVDFANDGLIYQTYIIYITIQIALKSWSLQPEHGRGVESLGECGATQPSLTIYFAKARGESMATQKYKVEAYKKMSEMSKVKVHEESKYKVKKKTMKGEEGEQKNYWYTKNQARDKHKREHPWD